MSLTKHASDVTSPIAARPTQTLFQELGVIFQSSLDLCFFMVLVPDGLIMGDQPSRDKIVIVGIQLVTAKPFLMGEAIDKGIVSKDFGSVCNRPARKARQAAIHVHTSSAIEISSLKVESTKVAPNSLSKARCLRSSKPLICTNTTKPLIFQRSQHPRKQFWWPSDIVIRENSDVSFDLGNCTNHLPSFVRVGDAAHADFGGAHVLHHQLCSRFVSFDRD